MTINCIVKKKKDSTKDKIGGPYDDTVVCVPKWKLEPKRAKSGNTMVHNGKTYFCCLNPHDGVMCICKKPENCNVNKTKVEANFSEEEKENDEDIDKEQSSIVELGRFSNNE